MNNIITSSIQVFNPSVSTKAQTKTMNFNERRLSGGANNYAIEKYKLSMD